MSPLGLTGGLLIPIAVGSLTGGILAAGRARREMKDRTAQIDRRGAMSIETGTKNADGESADNILKTSSYQHSVSDLYNRVKQVGENQQDSELAAIYYLVKHKVGREDGLNMLQYEGDKSISKQHIDMIILIRSLFPDLVSRFNSGDLFDLAKTDDLANLTREKYSEINKLSKDTFKNRISQENNYALKQGAIYAGVSATVGATVGGVLNILGYGITPGQDNISKATDIVSNGQITSTHYPDDLHAYTNVKRGFWFDNKTASPNFDHTELMIHTDKSGGWNVSNMIGKSPFSNNHNFGNIQDSTFTSGKIQAVITPSNGGPSFILPIDSKGNIQIPDSLKDAFNSRSFKFLEVGEVKIDGDVINLNPIATVKGNGSMLFNPITDSNVCTDLANTNIPCNDNYYGVPFGWNKYHHLGEPFTKKPSEKQEDIVPSAGGSDRVPEGTFDNILQDEDDSFINTENPITGLNNSDKNTSVDSLFIGEVLDNNTKGELSNNQIELNEISSKIIKIRNELENSDKGIDLTNDKTNKELIAELSLLTKQFDEKKVELDKKTQKLKEEKVSNDLSLKYKNNIKELTNSGILATKNDKPMMYNWFGRTILAVKTKTGGVIPFYRSSAGTSGKQTGNWYPCFGISDNYSWLIKGNIEGLKGGHDVKELQDIQDKLNNLFDWPLGWDTDYVYNTDKNPLAIAGSTNSYDWIKDQESKQKSKKPLDHTDSGANEWIEEWILRVSSEKNDPENISNLEIEDEDIYKELINLKRLDKIELGENIYRKVNNGWQKFEKNTLLAGKNLSDGYITEEEFKIDYLNFKKK